MSRRIISRLSRYRNALIRLKKMGVVRIFSVNLAESAGVSASIVRKDFSLFGITGKRKAGYIIDDLMEKINTILGKNKVQRFIIVGMGNIGRALAGYRRFRGVHIKIEAGFDVDPRNVSKDAEFPVFPLEEMKDYIRSSNIKMGIIAVQDIAAQKVLDLMVDAGIKGVLNFAPINLKLPKGKKDCIIDYVNLESKLEKIAYFVNLHLKRRTNEKN